MRRRCSFWLGQRRELDGQAFEVVAVGAVRSRAGRSVPVLTWASRCAACGRLFSFTTARKPRDDDLRRLCRRHHLTRRDVRRALRRLLAVGPAISDHEEDIDHA